MWRTVPVAVVPGWVFPLQSAKRLISHISHFTFHISRFTFHLSLSPYPDISSSGVTNAMSVGARLHAQTHQVGDVADAQFVHHPGFVDFDRS